MKNLINSLITLYKFIKTPKSDKEFVFFSSRNFIEIILKILLVN